MGRHCLDRLPVLHDRRGLVNEAIASVGGEKIQFLLSPSWFRTFITGEVMWKETGWGTIIFLAALAA